MTRDVYKRQACNSGGGAFAWGSNYEGQCGMGAGKIATPQGIMSEKILDTVFTGSETTFGLTGGKLYGLGNNAGNVLQEGNTANYFSEALVTGQHQNDSLETKKTIYLFEEHKNAVDVTLPNNTPVSYTHLDVYKRQA